MHRNIFFKVFVLLVITTFFITPTLIGAEDTGNPTTDTGNISTGPIVIKNPFNCGKPDDQCTLYDFIKRIINEIFIPIGAVIAVVMVIYAGLLYVTAGGNPGQIERAHKALLWAVIGAAILLGAWVIANAIEATIDQLKKTSG